MGWFLYIVYLVLLLLIIRKNRFFTFPGQSHLFVSSLFLIKVIAGFFVWYIYSYFYTDRTTADAFSYYDDGLVIYSALREHPADFFRMITGIGGDSPHLMAYYDTCRFWIKPFNYGLFNDSRTMIRLNALLSLISAGNYHIHVLFVQFLAFTGLTGLYRIFTLHFKVQRFLLAGIVYLLPSVLFWTSGLFKESVLMFAFGGFLWQVHSIFLHKLSIKRIAFLLLFLLLLLMLKFYVIVSAAPGIAWLVLAKRVKRGRLIWFTAIHVAFFFSMWLVKPLLGYDFPRTVYQKQHDFVSFAQSLGNVGSLIELPELKPQFDSFLLHSPGAFYNTLMRPFIWESGSLTQKVAGLENILILTLVLMALFSLRSQVRHNAWSGFSASFVIIMFILCGLTTPVLGALVRYKVPALPFLGVLLLHQAGELCDKTIEWAGNLTRNLKKGNLL